MNLYHNSHKIFYRNPFGAVPCGETISLKLEIRDCDEETEVYLNYISENQGVKNNRMSLYSKEDKSKTFELKIYNLILFYSQM